MTKAKVFVDMSGATQPQPSEAASVARLDSARVRRVTTLQHYRWPNLVWVELEDEDGVVGLGETFSLADAVVAYIHEGAAPYLLGQPAGDIARHWTTLHRQRGRSGIGAETRGASAIDIALWDLAAKRASLPLVQMLGGRSRERIRTYNTCAGPDYVRAAAVAGRLYTGEYLKSRYDDLWGFMNEPEKLVEGLLDEGFRAMKIWPFDEIAVETGGLHISPAQLEQGFEPLRRIRAAHGDAIDIALELHTRWSLPAAITIAREAEPFRPMWVEDPIRVLDNVDALARLCRATTCPILVGETLGARFAYREVLERTDVSIIMSDPLWTGGVSEIRRIADLTATHQRSFTPHDCTGPIGLAVGTHVSLYAETAIFQEMVRAFLYGWYREVAEGLPVVEDGHIAPVDRSGHGVSLHERPAAGDWHKRTSGS